MDDGLVDLPCPQVNWANETFKLQSKSENLKNISKKKKKLIK